MLDTLDRALEHEPDLVCLPEAFPTAGLKGLAIEAKTEPIPGPTTEAVAKRAAGHRCSIICPVKTARDGRFFNSAVIIDRTGAVCGVYDKACPVTSSSDYTVFEDGVTPGPSAPVFDLDVGRIGIQICFDAGFPENWRALERQRARLVFWPSAYDGGFSLRAYAYLHHYYVISSVRRGVSRVIDPLGAVVCETGADDDFIVRDINLDFVVYHGDFNHGIARRIEAAYGDRVAVRNSAPGSAHYLVEPTDPAVTCEHLQQEFGFEATALYHDRHRRAYRRMQKGDAPEPQQPAHANRPQYGR